MPSAQERLSLRRFRQQECDLRDVIYMTEKKQEAKKEAYSPEPGDAVLTVPNILSMFRILTIPLIVYLMIKNMWTASLIAVFFSAITDGIDGYVARAFNQVSKLGQILDPAADRLFIFGTVAAMGFAHLLPWWFIIAVFARDIVLGIFCIVLAQYDYGPLPVHFCGKTGTAVIMFTTGVMIFANLLPGNLYAYIYALGAAYALWGIILYWISAFIYFWQGAKLIKEAKNNRMQTAGEK